MKSKKTIPSPTPTQENHVSFRVRPILGPLLVAAISISLYVAAEQENTGSLSVRVAHSDKNVKHSHPSPDGRYVVEVDETKNWTRTTFLCDAKTQIRRAISFDVFTCYRVLWSPDSTHFAITSHIGTDYDECAVFSAGSMVETAEGQELEELSDIRSLLEASPLYAGNYDFLRKEYVSIFASKWTGTGTLQLAVTARDKGATPVSWTVIYDLKGGITGITSPNVTSYYPW